MRLLHTLKWELLTVRMMWFSNVDTTGRTSSYCERVLLMLSHVNELQDLMCFHCNVILHKAAFASKARDTTGDVHQPALSSLRCIWCVCVFFFNLNNQTGDTTTTFSTVHICAAVFSKTNIGVFFMYFCVRFFLSMPCQAAIFGSQVFYGTNPASEEKDDTVGMRKLTFPPQPPASRNPTVWITLVVWRRKNGTKTQTRWYLRPWTPVSAERCSLKQKQGFHSLRHRHSRSCAFDHSRKTERGNIFTQVQLSATQAALRSTDEITTPEPGLAFMIRAVEEEVGVGEVLGRLVANRPKWLQDPKGKTHGRSRW